MVPLHVGKIKNLNTKEAHFILIVEKDATFQRLIDDGFVSNMMCIIITVCNNFYIFKQVLCFKLCLNLFCYFSG